MKYLDNEYEWVLCADDTKFKGPIANVMTKMFGEAYNQFCDKFNPQIEAINVAYDRVCGDLHEDLMDPESIYMSFFREKEQLVADLVYKLNPLYGGYFKRFYIGPKCDFRAETVFGTNVWFMIRKREES